MENYTTIRAEHDDGLLQITLNRPERLNAFTVQMADELEDVYRRAGRDDRVRAIVVTGAGKHFCAGMDLSVGGNVFGLDESLDPTLRDLRERPVSEAVERGVRDTGGRVALAMYECVKPIVGAINGSAVGVGATMTLPMDFRLASHGTRIGFVFGRIGITPDACSTWYLPRLVGLQQALEWFYRADMIEAREAFDKGLFRSLHERDDLVEDARGFARSLIRERSPLSLALIRQMVLRNSAQPDPRYAHDVESLAMFRTSIGDGKEGVAAFLEKRRPVFTARAADIAGYFE